MAPVIVTALFVWSGLCYFWMGGGHMQVILFHYGQDAAAYANPLIPNYTSLGSALFRFVLGAVVILAIAYSAHIGAVRVEVAVLVVWTVGFGLYAANAHPGAPICDGYHPCYYPLDADDRAIGLWVLVASAIVILGALIRRGSDLLPRSRADRSSN